MDTQEKQNVSNFIFASLIFIYAILSVAGMMFAYQTKSISNSLLLTVIDINTVVIVIVTVFFGVLFIAKQNSN